MRFIKKASLKDLNEVCKNYKEIELYTTREDFCSSEKIKENIDLIRKNYEINNAIVTVIHCPESKWITPIDMDKEISTNYMSLCEVISDGNEEELLFTICNFAKSISDIYNKSNAQSLSNKSVQQYDNLLNHQDNEAKEEKNTAPRFKIILILHTGCILGCFSNELQESFFDCPFKQADRSKCFQDKLTSNSKVEEIVAKIIGYETLQIVFENITPFIYEGNIGSNSGYMYENLFLAKSLNKLAKEIIIRKEILEEEWLIRKNKTSEYELFGVVIDFCHIIANKNLLNIQSTSIEYLEKYLKRIEKEDMNLIKLFHLSNFNKDTGGHGDIFSESDEDRKVLDFIRIWCVKNARYTPITLEVSGGENVEVGIEKFNKLMMEWSKIYILLERHLSDELYNFFSNLFTVYSLTYSKKNKFKIFEAAQSIRRYVLEKSKLDNKLFGFTNKHQELNIYLFQVQSYVYYMRYCNLAFDLIKKYENTVVNISTVLSHYIFDNNLEEIKFDGLGSYYNIYWLKNNINLYRCFDGCSGDKEYSENQFNNIVSTCFSHINGGFKDTQFLSFSKSFGRVVLKYFNPYECQKSNGIDYNLEVFKNAPVNSFFLKDKQITLQEYQYNPVDYLNFSIDFSDFYNGRGDKDKEASLKELYEKVPKNAEWIDSKVGSIYDQEVIFCNYNNLNIQKYFLSDVDFVILMVSYKLILRNYKKFNDINFIVDSVVNKRDSIFNSEYMLQIKNQGSIKINETILKEILKSIDFVYEQTYPVDTAKDGFTEFTRNFIDIYNKMESMDFYKEIIQEIEKNDKQTNY